MSQMSSLLILSKIYNFTFCMVESLDALINVRHVDYKNNIVEETMMKTGAELMMSIVKRCSFGGHFRFWLLSPPRRWLQPVPQFCW